MQVWFIYLLLNIYSEAFSHIRYLTEPSGKGECLQFSHKEAEIQSGEPLAHRHLQNELGSHPAVLMSIPCFPLTTLASFSRKNLYLRRHVGHRYLARHHNPASKMCSEKGMIAISSTHSLWGGSVCHALVTAQWESQ